MSLDDLLKRRRIEDWRADQIRVSNFKTPPGVWVKTAAGENSYWAGLDRLPGLKFFASGDDSKLRLEAAVNAVASLET